MYLLWPIARVGKDGDDARYKEQVAARACIFGHRKRETFQGIPVAFPCQRGPVLQHGSKSAMCDSDLMYETKHAHRIRGKLLQRWLAPFVRKRPWRSKIELTNTAVGRFDDAQSKQRTPNSTQCRNPYLAPPIAKLPRRVHAQDGP